MDVDILDRAGSPLKHFARVATMVGEEAAARWFNRPNRQLAFKPRGAAGPWNRRGVIVVYTAEHPALAAMELLTVWDDYRT